MKGRPLPGEEKALSRLGGKSRNKAEEMDSDFLDSCREIKRIDTKRLNGKELACAAVLIYGAGLMRKELPTLKTKDVLNQKGEIPDTLNTGEEEIHLPAWVKEEVQQYVGHLRERNDGQLDPEAPLFPSYASDKRIYRHLKKHLGTFHSLGRERVQSLYLEYRKAGIENEEAYEKVARQFRLTARRVRDVILNIR